MTSEDSIRATGVRILLMEAQARGLDVESYLKSLSLESEKIFNDPECRIPARLVPEIFRDVPKLCGVPLLGLHAAENVTLEYSVSEHLVRSSRNLREAFQVVKYGMIVNPTLTLEFEEHSSGAGYYNIRSNNPSVILPREYVEYILAIGFLSRRKYSSTPWSPEKVEFREARPGGSREHEDFFGCPVVFNAKADRLILSKATLDIPITHTNPSLFKLLSKLAEQELVSSFESSKDATTPESLKAQVKRVLSESLTRRETQAEKIARQLGMSSKTLQRRLKQEGTTFHDVLDDLRIELAESLLKRRSEISIDGISHLLGFSEPSAFYKAYRRWTGKSLTKMS